MRRYARSLLRDRDAADDLVQDSLERALSRMERWTTGDSPRRWLFTIMHHLFVDQLRRTKRHGQIVAMMPETIGGAATPPQQDDKVEVARGAGGIAEDQSRTGALRWRWSPSRAFPMRRRRMFSAFPPAR